MDEIGIKDLTIEQYLRLTQENQTPKKIEDMTIAEYVEYKKKMSAESDCDSEDMEEEGEYMTNDKVVMSEQEKSNHGNTQNIQHFEEKDDVDKWLNAEITKYLSIQGVKNTKDALISIIKSIKKEMKDDIMKNQIKSSTANIDNETSSIANSEVDAGDDNTSSTASCLLPKELSPGSFLLPFNIDNHNLYAITTLEAKDNIMPLDVYKYLGLDKLRDTGTVENTTKTNEPLGAIGRPFLKSTHAQINVFNKEISFEIGSEKFKFDKNSHQCIEKIYMIDMAHKEETFNPLEIRIDLFSYESPACLEFEQRSRSYGTTNPQDEIAKPISFSPDRRGLVKRWHVCKPIHVTYDNGNGEDCGMWLTGDPDLKLCFGYNEDFGVNKQGDLGCGYVFLIMRDETVKRSYIGFADFLQDITHESDHKFIFNEWILDSYDVEEEYAREVGDPYSRRFDEYNRVFKNEIEHLSNEYILRIGKKGYVLDDVWEKCQQNYKKINKAWHDEAYEEHALKL
ncbi:hypothetical protein Tco_1072538 [Tanacetum coccineum]